MTREESIEVIKQDIPCEHDADLIEALEMAIQALSQEPMRDFTKEEAKAYSKALDKMYKPTGFNVFNEPCDDAISRQAVYGCLTFNGHYDTLNEVYERISKLPSVNPQPCDDAISREYLVEHIKACWTNGRPMYSPDLSELLSWIDDVPPVTQKSGQWIIDRSVLPYTYTCNICGRNVFEDYDYCPNCGCRMESEEE